MQPIIIICLIWIIWTLTWMAIAIAGDPGPHALKGPLLFLYRLTMLAATFLLFTITPWPGLDVQYRFWDRAPNEELGWVLVGVTLAGFVLAWWATIAKLIAHRRQQDFADNGPFRYLRQPVYLGLTLSAFATAVLFGRPSSLLGAIAMMVAFLVKILIDERVLREAVPSYEDYVERVWMFLPVPKRRDEETAAHAAIEEAPVKEAAMSFTAENLVTEPAPESDDQDLEDLFEPAPEAAVAPQEPPKPPVKAVQLSLTLDDLDESEGERDAVLSNGKRKV